MYPLFLQKPAAQVPQLHILKYTRNRSVVHRGVPKSNKFNERWQDKNNGYMAANQQKWCVSQCEGR